MTLSDAARSVWAKSPNTEGAWLPLWQHMDDSADIAGGLFDTWLAPSAVELLAMPFAGDIAVVRTAITFLAGMHDLGKATPAFAIQDGTLAQRMREHGLYMPSTKAELVDRRKVHHSLAGHHLLCRWLVNRGWPRTAVATWAVVLGGHHGVPPNSVSITEGAPSEFPCLYGEGRWEDVQRELADRVTDRTGAGKYLDEWREVRLPASFQVLVTGLVILADWIASNESLLPYHTGHLPKASENARRAQLALERLALPMPWRPALLAGSVAEQFAVRFRLPAGAAPRPVQEAVCEVATGMSAPGLVIIEAPMGEGKTEAALAAAEIMSRRWGAGGVHVALPTQATADAMFERVVAWLDTFGSDEQLVGAVTLSHGKARSHRLYQGMIRSGRPAQIGSDETGDRHAEHAVVAHAWLSGRKKSQLANFVIGTIDQLLFAGLKSRHLMLRHLALAGKTVVIDEIHAYDAFMNSYLEKVLTWLGAYRVPVLALSATLPPDRRHTLLDAYQRGCFIGDETHAPAGFRPVSADTGYPVISWTEEGDVRTRDVAPSGRHITVSLDAVGGSVDNDTDALTSLLEELMSEGGCALVVRNTVARVLHTATSLEQAFPGEVTVAHSRFITADRLRKDSELLDRFGPPDRAHHRPERHIVVASQVVEQSLDVDFDLLVTDLAPVDLVLQRMGRLHRHWRGDGQAERPSKLRIARTYIAGADFTRQPPELETASSRHVYGTYPMLRSAAVLMPRIGATVTLPDDIAPLVRAAYGGEDIEPPSWRAAVDTARVRFIDSIEQRAAKARDYQIGEPQRPGKAILGWVSGSVGEADDEAQGQGQVRDGVPTLEAILVQQSDSGDWHTPDWLPEGQERLVIPQDATPPEDVASVLLTCAVRLPLEFSNASAEEALWAQTPEPWEHSPLIYRLPVVVVDHRGEGHIAGRPIRYTPDRGLEVFKS